MTINFYDTRLKDDKTTILVKERAIEYDTEIKTDNPKDVAGLMRRVLEIDKLAEEHCYMIVMNNACKILGLFFISKGNVSSSLISAREVYMRALLIGGSMIILIHNHPSGRAEPTRVDIETSAKIKQAGDLMGIPLIDHIIIGDRDYYSFKENNSLQ
ncbi:MAG: JAB domain-containing protein [Lachnospiraceae bacterium]|nr:JAB domain-containing protein [Lachnospiraceae bacterium]